MAQTEKTINEDEESEKLSETEVVKIADLIDKIEKILKDKYSLSIIAELMVNSNSKLTAKKLESLPTIDMKKSLLYSKLKLLEEYNFITSEYQVKENETRGYAQKVYTLDKDHFGQLINTMMDYKDRPELARDARLVYFSILQAFLDREVKILLNISNEDYIKERKNYKSKFNKKEYHFGILQFLKKNEFEFFMDKREKLNKETIEFIRENKRIKGGKNDDDTLISPHFTYSGYLYFPELERNEEDS